jgi:hypothetical protein
LCVDLGDLIGGAIDQANRHKIDAEGAGCNFGDTPDVDVGVATKQ